MLAGLTDAEYAGLSSTMMTAWTQFARTRTPTVPDMPWPAYDPDRRITLCFGPITAPIGDPAGATWRLAR